MHVLGEILVMFSAAKVVTENMEGMYNNGRGIYSKKGSIKC